MHYLLLKRHNGELLTFYIMTQQHAVGYLVKIFASLSSLILIEALWSLQSAVSTALTSLYSTIE